MADTRVAPTAAPAADPDPLWDDWDTPPRVPGMPELHLAGFDGPMDLLLDLAERQRIDLGQVSMLQLAEQFVAAMARLEQHVALERRADWLVMAARLLLLRSRLLFPSSPAAEQDAAGEPGLEGDWLDQILAVRAAATWLERRPQLGRDVFARPTGRPNRVTSYMALMEACLTVLRGIEGKPGNEVAVYVPVLHGLFRVGDAIERIRLRLAAETDAVALERCLPTVAADAANRELKARSAVASTFLGMLELVRGGELQAKQAERFAPILVTTLPLHRAAVTGSPPLG